MKRNHLLFGLLLGAVGFFSVQAEENAIKKVIYKWESQGLIHYSHIKPRDVVDFIKLDTHGRRIEDISEDYDEIVEIAVRPNASDNEDANDGGAEEGSKDIEEGVAAARQAKVRGQNCDIATNNMSTLNSGEVYEPDSKGNMIRLTPEEIEAKRKNVQKDIDYFCDQ